MIGFISYIVMYILICAVPIPMAVWFLDLARKLANHLNFEVYTYDPFYLQIAAAIYAIIPFLAGFLIGCYLIIPIINRLPLEDT